MRERFGRWGWLAGLMMAIMVAGCATPPPLPPVTSNGITVQLSGFEVGPNLVRLGINGTATNTRLTSARMVALTIEVLDGSGVKVAEAMAITQNISPGQSWRFMAPMNPPLNGLSSVTLGKVVARVL